MSYSIISTDDYWLPQECTEPIEKHNNGLNFLEEVLLRPYKPIAVVNLCLQYTEISRRQSPLPYIDYIRITDSDYIQRCYQEAREEHHNALYLFKLYKQYEMKIHESMYVNSETEAQYHIGKLEELRKVISKFTREEGYLDTFIRRINHQMYNTFQRTIEELAEPAPILHNLLTKTFTNSRSVVYQPELDSGFDLVIQTTIG